MSEQIDWSKAPAGYDLAYSTGPFWDGDDRHKGQIKFARLNSYCLPQTSTGEVLQENERSWVVVGRLTTTPSWSGEGLPPVGVVCEVRNAPGGWGKATIKYQGKGIIVWLWDRQDGNTDQIEFASCPDRLEFRPIRTPEQIAADEREAAINELHTDLVPAPRHVVAIIYDAMTRLGYRKS